MPGEFQLSFRGEVFPNTQRFLKLFANELASRASLRRTISAEIGVSRKNQKNDASDESDCFCFHDRVSPFILILKLRLVRGCRELNLARLVILANRLVCCYFFHDFLHDRLPMFAGNRHIHLCVGQACVAPVSLATEGKCG